MESGEETGTPQGGTLRGEPVGTDQIDGLPMCDKDGNIYRYRAVETEMVVKNLDGSLETLKIADGQIGGYKVTEIHSAEQEEAGSSDTASGQVSLSADPCPVGPHRQTVCRLPQEL